MGNKGDPRDPARREMLRQSLTLAGVVALGSIGSVTSAAADEPVADAHSDPHPSLGRTLRRIAFGCCAAP